MADLRQRHAAAVHVCSLDGGYFIVSNRMAVERQSQSDLAAMQNRKRLTERVTGMLRLFERVCLIVEKDRNKPGQWSRWRVDFMILVSPSFSPSLRHRRSAPPLSAHALL